MPRHSREQSGTGIYHVMLRGVNRQSIFEDDEDYIRFISLLESLFNALTIQVGLCQPYARSMHTA